MDSVNSKLRLMELMKEFVDIVDPCAVSHGRRTGKSNILGYVLDELAHDSMLSYPEDRASLNKPKGIKPKLISPLAPVMRTPLSTPLDDKATLLRYFLYDATDWSNAVVAGVCDEYCNFIKLSSPDFTPEVISTLKANPNKRGYYHLRGIYTTEITYHLEIIYRRGEFYLFGNDLDRMREDAEVQYGMLQL